MGTRLALELSPPRKKNPTSDETLGHAGIAFHIIMRSVSSAPSA